MRPRALLAVSAAILASLTTLSLTTAIGTTAASAETQSGQAKSEQVRSAKACGTPSAGHAACMSKVRTNATGKPLASADPDGFSPKDIES
ncbi:MAG: hypothetical protein QOE58_1878, partial [Actinomycetota bacterium]|nr:hypothetical protein [Actinomycetota bacterium]